VTTLVSPDIQIKLCDLMSVLTGSWDLDWTSPVKVEMAECVRQMLQLSLGQR